MVKLYDRIIERAELARVYGEDGAYRSAARVLRDMADELDAHMDHCDIEFAEALAGGAPIAIEPRGDDPHDGAPTAHPQHGDHHEAGWTPWGDQRLADREA